MRARLRSFGEPITLFGEDKADRRNRLRDVMLKRYESGLPVGDNIDLQRESSQDVEMGDSDEDEDEEDEDFYTPGTTELLEARRKIYLQSIKQSHKRTSYQRIISKFPTATHVAFRRKFSVEQLGNYTLIGSQIVSARPASMTRFNCTSSQLAVAAWSGEVKIFSAPSLEPSQQFPSTITVGTDKPSIAWSTTNDSQLAVGAADGKISLYDLGNTHDPMETDEVKPKQNSPTPIQNLEGHEQRVGRLAFHPNGDYLGSASFDLTWRLWDINTGTELLTQEGHSKEVFCIAFHPDGSLCGTAGLDNIARIWDIRTGRGIMSMLGHARPIYGIDFSSNGYHVITGSADATIKVWDLRQRSELFTIPAHKSVISDVKYYSDSASGGYLSKLLERAAADPEKSIDEDDMAQQNEWLSHSGSFFVSSSYDRTVKIWNSDTWTLAGTLLGHSDKVMSVDVSSIDHENSNNEVLIASSGWDRTVKLWNKDEF